MISGFLGLVGLTGLMGLVGLDGLLGAVRLVGLVVSVSYIYKIQLQKKKWGKKGWQKVPGGPMPNGKGHEKFHIFGAIP